MKCTERGLKAVSFGRQATEIKVLYLHSFCDDRGDQKSLQKCCEVWNYMRLWMSSVVLFFLMYVALCALKELDKHIIALCSGKNGFVVILYRIGCHEDCCWSSVTAKACFSMAIISKVFHFSASAGLQI